MNDKGSPRVLILMGSDSDWPVVKAACDLLEEFGVPHRATVASAHRTPERVRELVQEAEAAGAGVFIAAAGMAAHLAGAVAALTYRPVIGVPLSSKMGGIDSLLSTAQMPNGVPVATVAVDGAANAALLAVQILAVGDPRLSQRLAEHKGRMRETVLAKAAKLVK
ncbi:MAG: 5-(carboxyamino)imidazole ribonucleotide mutase [Elusimicrobia bacterium GWA2_69_24]|nr:MAG: 5-(carboxyamino)imidazole ribonucleotide mutase [Elusimicrobia bacterium GWA2_69_24]